MPHNMEKNDIEAAISERTLSVEAQQEKHTTLKDADDALNFLLSNQHVSTEDIDEKALMRKVDWMLMPLMFLCYYLQYSDKTIIMGFIKDTKLPPDGFSNLASFFYVAIIVAEPLQTFCVQKFPVAKWLGINVILWGVVVTCNCAVTNYGSVMALRILLACFEAAVTPALIIITGMWYKRNEQVIRMGIWYQGIAIGPAVSSLVSYGFLKSTGSPLHDSFKSWHIVYLLFGLITIVVGILVILFLPDNPMTSSRLTPAEKIHIINRVRSNETGIENKNVKWSQVCETLTDYRNYLIFLIVVACAVPNGIVSSFSSTIISSFGYDKYQTLLLNLPGAAVTFVAVIFATVFAGRHNARGLAIISLLIPTMLGGALQAWLPRSNKPGLLIGNALTSTTFATVPVLYSWITANYAGHSKKTTMAVVVLIALCVGNAIGPKTFRARDAPKYLPAKVCIFGFLAGAVVLILVVNWVNRRENGRRDGLGSVEMPEEWQLLDLTDKENLRFRYCL